MTQKAAADAGGDGLSLAVWSLIEHAKQHTYRDRTLIAVERALQWPRGAVQMLLDGGDPDVIAGLMGPPSPASPRPVSGGQMASVTAAATGTVAVPLEARVAELERSVSELRQQVAAFQMAATSRAELGLAADADRPTSIAEVRASRRRHRPAPDPNE